MIETGTTGKKLKKAAKLLSLTLVSLLGVVALALAGLRIYLSTPLPAPQLSRLVTSRLQQSFSIQDVEVTGRSLVLKKVRLQNPPGFREADLFSAEVVTIAPHWFDLLLGRQRFRLLAVEKGRLDLEKDSRGAWNFANLQQRLAEKKPPEERRPAVETFVDRLQIKDGAVSVQGRELQGISLQVFNLASAGSRQARVELAFEDGGRNRYWLKGTARPGQAAALDLSLTAPSLSLRKLAPLIKVKDEQLLRDAQGALQANAVLLQGELRGSAVFSFSKLSLPASGGRLPVAGSLNVSGSYNLDDDTAQLRAATLSVDRFARLHAAGSVRGVKKERSFALLAEMDQADLAMLNVLFADSARAGLLFGGRVRCDALRVEGDANGLKSAAGALQLADGSLSREGQLLVSGLSGKVELAGRGSGIALSGRVAARRHGAKALVESLDLPFSATLSRQLKLIRAETPALSARAMGGSVAGRASFQSTGGDRLSAGFKFVAAGLSELNPLLERYGVQASSGTASGTLVVAGSGAQDLRGWAKLQLSGFKGSRGKDTLGLNRAAVAAQVRRGGGHLQAQGSARLGGLTFNGKSGDASFDYRVVDRWIYLKGARGEVAGRQFSVAALTARLPVLVEAGGVSRYPVLADVEGVAAKLGDAELANLSGRLRGSLATAGKEKWLEGTAELSSRSVSWRGTELQAAVLHAVFSRGRGVGNIAGQLLGGRLAGRVSLDPFAPGSGTAFNADLTGAEAARLSRLLPKDATIRPTAGSLDLHLSGNYAGAGGLSCRFDSKGSGVGLADSRKKQLLSGASLSLSGALSGGKLTLHEGTLSPGKGVLLKAKGEVARAFSAQRRGTLTFTAADTQLNTLVDSLINLVPPTIQEASLDGTVGLDGRVELGEGRTLVEGGLGLKGVRVEVPAQKLVVSAVNGKLPFSLDFGGTRLSPPRDGAEFNRENYPRVLARLREAPAGGETVSLGKVVLGTLEMGTVTLQLRAANGVTEVSSLRSALYEGTVLGKGYFAMGDRARYRVDLLVNGLSMKNICRTLNMQGYIAGRVDGVISVQGVGGGTAGMTGFLDLWAREGGGEKMLVSKQFLQRLAKQKMTGFFLSSDRPYDRAEIKATLEDGDLTFSALNIVNTNFLGVRDLSVTIAPSQNRIALDHLLESIKEAAQRGKPAAGEDEPKKAPEKPEIVPEFKWEQ